MAEITPNHPDYGLNQQIRQGVAALDAQHGRAFDQTSERLTASLTVLAREQGLQQVDHVLVSNATAQHPAGHNIFVVQGDPANPARLRANPAPRLGWTSAHAHGARFLHGLLRLQRRRTHLRMLPLLQLFHPRE